VAALGLLLLLTAPGHASAAPCAAPAVIEDGWQSADPETAGFDGRALCSVLDGVARGDLNIHSVVVERRGRLVAEMYRRGKDRSVWDTFAHDVEFGPTVLHDMRSVSKSVVSLLFGIARGQDKIGPLTTPVRAFYSDLGAQDAATITLEQLLTMSSGLEWHETLATYGSLANDETRLLWSRAPSRLVLSRPVVVTPGTQFNYNGGGTVVLADILTRATHTPLRDFARATLFEPLGIREWEWVGDLYGRPNAFAGLRMRPRDVTKIGRTVLDHGQWQGRQIVPASWVAEALRPHIAAGDGLQYGYQWWTGTIARGSKPLRWSAAFGNGGQRLFVVPELDLTVVITAGAYNDPRMRGATDQIFRQIVGTVRSANDAGEHGEKMVGRDGIECRHQDFQIWKHDAWKYV